MCKMLFIASLILFTCNLLNYLLIRSSCPATHTEQHSTLTSSPSPAPLVCSKLKDQLARYICEVEAMSVFYTPHTPPMVAAKDISTVRYYAQRDLQGWTMAYTNHSFEVLELSYRTSVKLADMNVFLCLGIHTQDKHCLKPAAYKTLAQGQRVSQIHMLRDVLWRKDAFCYTMREALGNYKGWNNFTFPCWVLPQDAALLQQAMSQKKGDWIVKPSFKGEGHGIYVISSYADLPRVMDGLVVQPFLSKPYLVKGKKFDFRTYVLVTSATPPRVYIYHEGLVRFASSRYNQSANRGGKQQQYLTNTSIGKKYTQLANLTWTYQRLRSYWTRRGVNATKVFDAVDNAIARTVLASEYRFLSDFR